MTSSFFDKLKKGMGIEEGELETKKEPEKKMEEKPKKPKKTSVPKTNESKNKKSAEVQEAEPINQEKAAESFPIAELKPEKKQWAEEADSAAGQLAADVYQTESDLVIQSAIAGVSIDNLEISMERDVITIKGRREKPFKEEGDYFAKECYWGSFARQIIMPVEVDPERAEASMKEGILTIRIPKILREKKRTIKVKI